MAASWSGDQPNGHSKEIDDAEKGLYSSTETLPAIPPLAVLDKKLRSPRIRELSTPTSPFMPGSPVHEGITPLSSKPGSSLSLEKLAAQSQSQGQGLTNNTALPPPPAPPALPKLPPPPKRKTSRWVLFRLWLHTYRKFFIIVVTFNLVLIILACLDRFPYAREHSGALVLGNLLCAVLMRNELFLRFLYTVLIYGLRGVSIQAFLSSGYRHTYTKIVGTFVHEGLGYLRVAACGRHPLRVRFVWGRVSLSTDVINDPQIG